MHSISLLWKLYVLLYNSQNLDSSIQGISKLLFIVQFYSGIYINNFFLFYVLDWIIKYIYIQFRFLVTFTYIKYIHLFNKYYVLYLFMKLYFEKYNNAWCSFGIWNSSQYWSQLMLLKMLWCNWRARSQSHVIDSGYEVIDDITLLWAEMRLQ